MMLRSCLLRSLAHAFTYPTTKSYGQLQSCMDACSQGLDSFIDRERQLLVTFLEVLRPLKRESYESEYLRVFTHVCAADCNPCETAYTAKHIFQASQRLATITGMYRTFGLEAGGERPDHIAVELEFLAFLRYREALECQTGQHKNQEILRRGQWVFIERHLGRWVRIFAELVSRKAVEGVIADLANLLPEVIANEAMSFGIELPELPSDLSLAFVNFESDVSPVPMPSGQSSQGVFHA